MQVKAEAAAGTIRSLDPATLDVVFEGSAVEAEGVRAAVAAARAAQPGWAAMSVAARADILEAFAALVARERESLAALVSREVGKPVPEAMLADLIPLLDAVDFLAKEGRRVLAPQSFRLTRPLLTLDRVSRVERVPLGVVAIIAPWNYPLAIPGSAAVYALFAGNAVVLKPSEHSPACASRVVELLHEAGVPRNVVQLLPGGPATGQALAAADVDAVVFTGSVATGARVRAAAAQRGIPCILELGGSDPAIVLEDADLEHAANGVVWGRFTNAGQTCAAVKRCLVLDSVADEFERLLVEKTAQLRVGSGASGEADVGPLISEAAVESMESFVADAVAKGARVLTAGRRAKAAGVGYFFEPTLLADVTLDMRVMQEEVFGPVLPILRVKDEEEAIRVANGTPFGLSASVWTRDVKRGDRVASGIDAGTVTVNDCVYTFAVNRTPWSGSKASGSGVAHGSWGLLELTRIKHVNLTPARRAWRNLWWFPYGPDQARVASDGVRFLYGGLRAKASTGAGLVRAILTKRNL